jgi:phosphatidyl-myo-inositol alpha-mannosyltransferase
MRIALVCPFDMLHHPGGVQQVVMHLHKGLKKRGHYVKIITQRPSNFKGEPPEDYILFGITRKFKGGLGTEGTWGMPSDGEEIARVMKQEQFDVINFHEAWIPWLAWQITRNSKTAYVATFHANLLDTRAGKVWTSPIFTPIGRPFLEKMHLFTATSPVAAGMLINLANMDSAHDRHMIENLRYIACGVELADFKPVKKRQPLNGPGTRTIAYVGRLEKRKGIDWLIKAFAELVKVMPETHLEIGGSGLWAKKMRQYVEDEQIPNIKFHGFVSDEEKRRLVGNADLACFPSPYGEGFGIVLLEAMAMGVPIIAGNNLGYAQVMKGFGRIGLVDPTATKDFANRLAVLLTDEQLRKSMIAWELNEVKQYDYPKIVGQYENAYQFAISLKNNGHPAKKAKAKNGKKSRKTLGRFFIRRHA